MDPIRRVESTAGPTVDTITDEQLKKIGDILGPNKRVFVAVVRHCDHKPNTPCPGHVISMANRNFTVTTLLELTHILVELIGGQADKNSIPRGEDEIKP